MHRTRWTPGIQWFANRALKIVTHRWRSCRDKPRAEESVARLGQSSSAWQWTLAWRSEYSHSSWRFLWPRWTRHREKSSRDTADPARAVHPFREQPGASSVLRGQTQTAVLHLPWTRSRLNRPSIPPLSRVRAPPAPRTSHHLTSPTALLFPTLRFSSLLFSSLVPSSALCRPPRYGSPVSVPSPTPPTLSPSPFALPSTLRSPLFLYRLSRSLTRPSPSVSSALPCFWPESARFTRMLRRERTARVYPRPGTSWYFLVADTDVQPVLGRYHGKPEAYEIVRENVDCGDWLLGGSVCWGLC